MSKTNSNGLSGNIEDIKVTEENSPLTSLSECCMGYEFGQKIQITSTTVLWDQELAAVLKPLCTERGLFSMCIDIYTQENTHSNPRDFGSETNTQQYMTIICMSVYLR